MSERSFNPNAKLAVWRVYADTDIASKGIQAFIARRDAGVIPSVADQLKANPNPDSVIVANTFYGSDDWLDEMDEEVSTLLEGVPILDSLALRQEAE